jgi:hypothetical protein
MQHHRFRALRPGRGPAGRTPARSVRYLPCSIPMIGTARPGAGAIESVAAPEPPPIPPRRPTRPDAAFPPDFRPNCTLRLVDRIRFWDRSAAVGGPGVFPSVEDAPMTKRMMFVAGWIVAASAAAMAQDGGGRDGRAREGDKPEFPPFEEVSKGYEKVVSTADGAASLYTLYVDRKKHQALAELGSNFEGQKVFIATSIAGGSRQTGYQWNDTYCYWTRQDDKLVLMEPNIRQQAKGGPRDAELRSAVERTYSDRVITSVKILAFGPGRGPVIDLDDLLVKNAGLFTGMGGNAALATIGKVKAFPQNIEFPVTMPMQDGRLTTLHYSISMIPKTDYEPRESDERIGFFLTVFKDFTRHEPDGNQFTRFINRWNLQKRDAGLKLSPPVKPIVFYIESTVPVRYRRHVRDGILEWNKAFAQCGFDGAVEVRQQDARTGAYMDIDPEDVRYNFFRWISSERAFAMGPSRVNPETGEILDADIIFDDSMLKLYALRYKVLIAAYGFDGVDPAALEWIEQRPLWNPLARLERLSPVEAEIAGDPDLTEDQKAELLGLPPQEPRGLLHRRVVQQNFACDYAAGKAMQMRTAQLAMRLMGSDLLGDPPAPAPGSEPGAAPGGENPPRKGDDTPMLDGVPEEYLGLVLKEIVMHEVGHTLGLRHNFKASTWLTMDQYAARKGEANVGSVMDYQPIRFPAEPAPGTPRGDWVTPTIGPYDYWAIKYGYTLDDKEREALVKQVARAELTYATDEDASGPDPYVNRYDLSTEPLDWATERLAVVKTMRGKLLDKAVSEGQGWHMMRQAYEQLLGEHLGAIRVASRYVGGVQINRDRKGDPDGRDPVVPVDAAKQRTALKFVIDNAFPDAAFDLRPEVLRKLATDKHRHWGNPGSGDETFGVHDRIASIQTFAMLYLMNPGTLGRVYDNELRTPASDDALTLPEVMRSVVDASFTELGSRPPGGGEKFTDRRPMISSLRRNLQSELTARLIDLALNGAGQPRPIQTLALHHLRQLNGTLDSLLGAKNGGMDEYTVAHLEDLNDRIDKALNAVQVAP